MTVVVAISINAVFNTLRPRQDDHNFAYHSLVHFFQTTKKSQQCVPKGALDHKMKIGFGNGLVPSKHQAITWVSGDPGQWCIYASLGLIELITSPYWEIYRYGAKRYCLSTPGIPSPPPPIAESGQLHQPRLWFITGGYLVKRWFQPAAARARGQSNDLNREILASNLFNCRKEVINAPPVPSVSRCIHTVYRHKNIWEYQWSNFIYNCMSTFLHYVRCKYALLDCSAPGGERCESLTRVDEIPTHQVGSGRGTGWPWFVKSPQRVFRD